MARRALAAAWVAAALTGCLSVPERDLPAYAGPTGVSPDASGGGGGGGVGGGGDVARVTDARKRDARPGAPDAETTVSPDGGVPRDASLSVDGGVASADDLGRPGPDVPCTAAPEQCNGLDDDCNGAIDDDGAGHPAIQVCYDGPIETEGVGPCLAGFERCEGAAWGACRGQVLPFAEVCDGVDDDCDGQIDEDAGPCACAPDERRGCYAGPEGTAGVGLCRAGEQVCDGSTSTFGRCEGEVRPTGEVCNGLDDDCNGAVDDALPGVGAPCSVESGACRSDGVTGCDPGSGNLVCRAPPVSPVDERCDGRDNNCDGRVDEDLPGCEGCDSPGSVRRCPVPPPGQDGVGLCRNGSQECLPERIWGPCRDLVVATDEGCNAQDDDCDGTVDESLQGPVCSAGEGACRVEGPTVCRDGRFVCELSAGGGPEVCNGLDDDCDGRADEDYPGVGVPCGVGQGACYAEGVVVCDANGQLTCTGRPGSPNDETCDAIDNDCDGAVDEDFPHRCDIP